MSITQKLESEDYNPMEPHEKPTTFVQFKHRVQQLFKQILHELYPQNSFPPTLFGSPPLGIDADFSVECFQFAKVLNEDPIKIAKDLHSHLMKIPFIIKVEIAPSSGNVKSGKSSKKASAKAYLNLTFDLGTLAPIAIRELLLEQKKNESDEHYLVEFSSPNANKPLHLGHIRNNCLGDSISQIIRSQGHSVTKINLINDRGIHICKSMLAYKKWATKDWEGLKGDHIVGNYYVLFEKMFQQEYQAFLDSAAGIKLYQAWSPPHQVVKTDPRKDSEFMDAHKSYYFNNLSALGKEAIEMLVKWESNDPETRDLWNLMNGWVMLGFGTTYQNMGITFDVVEKESDIYLEGKKIVLEGLATGIFEKNHKGEIYCDLQKLGFTSGKNRQIQSGDENSDKKILLRANGTSVYMTQDLGTATNRLRLYQPSSKKPLNMIYVVASEQDHHFEVLFRILQKLNPLMEPRLFHLSYGMVHLPSGRMKSREGTVVDADDLLLELESEAFAKTKNKWPDLDASELRHRAHCIALAALKYHILHYTPQSNITFDTNKSIDFKGNSGPYLLYTYARTRNVLAKASLVNNQVELDFDSTCSLQNSFERNLVLALLSFPDSIQKAFEFNDPSKIAHALFEIAKRFNLMYKEKIHCAIIQCPDPTLRKARLMLTLGVGSALKRGLDLMGIDVLESM